MTYNFEYKDMAFSKDGQLDELIVLDRYATPSYTNYQIGDTVVAIVDKEFGTKKVGEITKIIGDGYEIKDRFGETHVVTEELLQKPLETKPFQLWERWAKGASSVEKTPELKQHWENEFRWLFDGYRYSLGGRIQLMLGQEFVTGERANLTAYNCFVGYIPKEKDGNIEQFLEVLKSAEVEANIMRRGGGVGLNISHINTVIGAERSKIDFNFVLDETHKDYDELLDRIELGKFDNVIVNDEVKVEDVVLHIGDSVIELFEGLNDLVKRAYDTNRRISIVFNDLRHRNALVKGVNGRSSGAVSWMEFYVLIAELLQKDVIDNVEFAEIFSAIVHLIIQGGSRRGALMLVCNSENENITKFITRKTQAGYLSGANISVGISDSFMESVKRAKNGSTNQTDLENLSLWDLIIKSAHASAEPGVIFLERYNKESNSWYYNQIEATNPCGEQGLPEYGVCNLGHFVLSRFYDEKTNDVNWNDLKRACKVAARLQDNIIDYTQYFLVENEENQLNERRVGIGSLALGTLLIKLGLRYGSDEGNAFVEKLYKFITYNLYSASIEIAKEKGSFPKFEYDKFIKSGFMKRMLNEFPEMSRELKQYGIRNVTLTTQAPTGSTGTYIDNIPEFNRIFGGASTGIEPYFSWEYWRAGRLGTNKQTVKFVQDYMDKHNINDIKDLPEHFVTAMELLPQDHVKVQAAVQKWTDSSISKTANCPNEYTVEQTDELYTLGYDLGLKGMTIYRSGSREAQVLATDEKDAKLESHIEAEKLKEIKSKKKVEIVANVNEIGIQKRPKRLYGFTEKVNFMYGDKMGRAYITINLNDGEPWEVFISTKVKEISSMAKSLGLMTTKLLRLGRASDNLQQAIDTLTYDQVMGTLPSVVANILKQLQKEKLELQAKTTKNTESIFTKCAECGEVAYDKVNCICNACGQSKCN